MFADGGYNRVPTIMMYFLLGLSYRDIMELLRDLLDVPVSMSTVHDVLKAATRQARRAVAVHASRLQSTPQVHLCSRTEEDQLSCPPGRPMQPVVAMPPSRF